MMAFLAPTEASTVRRMSSSRQGDRVCSQTSSGTTPGVSIRRRVKSKSVCDAEGKETSISLYPRSTSILKYFHFVSLFCGAGNSSQLQAIQVCHGHSHCTYHGINQTLVSIAKIGGQPSWCL